MIDKNPLVSVITPSFNQGHFIKRTIDSVLQQSYNNIEYIVIDGGSKDETIEILKSYGDKLKWVSEPDKGQSDALNKGLALAQGQIIGWLNSDDLYLPDAIKIAVSSLTENPEFELIYGKGYIIDVNNNITRTCPNIIPFSPDALAACCILCQPSTFFTKSLVDKVGGLNQDLHYCMDYDLWVRMSKVTKFLYLPVYFSCFRMYQDNKTSSKNFEFVHEILMTVKKHYGVIHPRWAATYAKHLREGKSSGVKFWFLSFIYFIYFNLKKPLYIIIFPFKISNYSLIKTFFQQAKSSKAASPTNK
jgi:glycosyltransferase involved in cell wall biosynthesis